MDTGESKTSSGSWLALNLSLMLACLMPACGGDENGYVSASQDGVEYGSIEVPPFACWSGFPDAVCDYIREPDEVDIAFTFRTDYRSVASGTVLADQVDFTVGALGFVLRSGPPNTGIYYFDSVDDATGPLTVTVGDKGNTTSATIDGSVTQQSMTLVFKDVHIQLP